MRRQLTIFSILFLISLISVNAAGSLGVTTQKVSGDAQVGGEVLFKLTIENKQNIDDTFQIVAADFSVYPFSNVARFVIAEPSKVEIPALSNKSVDVKISLLDDVKPNQNYGVDVWVKSVTNSAVKVKKSLAVYVISPKELINIDLVMPKEMVPGKDVLAKINLQNRLGYVLEDLDLYVTSPLFSERRTVSFFPYDNRTEEFVFRLEPNAEPGKYTFNIRVYQEQDLKGVLSTDFTVLKNPDIKESKVTDKGFLMKRVTITKINEGNSPIEERIRFDVTRFQKMFTSVDPAVTSTTKGDKVYYLNWEFSVGPNESYDVTIVTDYKPIIIILLLLVLIVVLAFYYYSKDVIIKKTIFRISGEKEGISELKILVHIQNKGADIIKNIKIIDFLPNLIKPTEEFGTLKPEKIQKSKRDIRMIWSIPTLEKGEERVISYKVKSKLHIVGEILLPSAVLQYRNKKGQMVSIKSDRLRLLPRKEKQIS